MKFTSSDNLNLQLRETIVQDLQLGAGDRKGSRYWQRTELVHGVSNFYSA